VEKVEGDALLRGSSGWQSFVPMHAPKGVVRLVPVEEADTPAGVVVGAVAVERVDYTSEPVPGQYGAVVKRPVVLRRAFLVVVEPEDDALARLQRELAAERAALSHVRSSASFREDELREATRVRDEHHARAERLAVSESEARRTYSDQLARNRKLEEDLAKVRRAIGDVAFDAAVGKKP
jgi:hypothetical protein